MQIDRFRRYDGFSRNIMEYNSDSNWLVDNIVGCYQFHQNRTFFLSMIIKLEIEKKIMGKESNIIVTC